MDYRAVCLLVLRLTCCQRGNASGNGLGKEMSVTKDMAGDNTLTISMRVNRQGRDVIEVIEYDSEATPTVHFTFEKGELYKAVDEANNLIREEFELSGIEHDYFSFVEVRDALYPNVNYWQSQLKAREEQITELGNYLGNLMEEGMIEGTEDLLVLMNELDNQGLIRTPKVRVHVTGTMTREFTVDCDIEVAPWHVNSPMHIERYYESEIVEATDDDYDCSTSLDIESVELHN